LIETAPFPTLRRGGRADQACNATLDSARPGALAQARQRAASREVKALLQEGSDLPRCALNKVARHLFKGRSDPSWKEGIKHVSRFFAIPQVVSPSNFHTTHFVISRASSRNRNDHSSVQHDFSATCSDGTGVAIQPYRYVKAHDFDVNGDGRIDRS